MKQDQLIISIVKKGQEMNTNQGALILAERAADDGTLRSILREWGYRETEIQRFLSDSKLDAKPDQRTKTTDEPARCVACLDSVRSNPSTGPCASMGERARSLCFRSNSANVIETVSG